MVILIHSALKLHMKIAPENRQQHTKDRKGESLPSINVEGLLMLV